jgi:hypothetical protein
MIILGQWLEGKMEETRQAFLAGRPAALAMVLGEMRGALVARDGNTDEVLTAIDRLGTAEKAAMRGALGAAREAFDAAAACIDKLIAAGHAQQETAAG